jgi:hypothetical protein
MKPFLYRFTDRTIATCSSAQARIGVDTSGITLASARAAELRKSRESLRLGWQRFSPIVQL